jgi:hypothetical protein
MGDWIHFDQNEDGSVEISWGRGIPPDTVTGQIVGCSDADADMGDIYYYDALAEHIDRERPARPRPVRRETTKQPAPAVSPALVALVVFLIAAGLAMLVWGLY